MSTYSDAKTRGGWENLRQLCSHETEGLNWIIIIIILFFLFYAIYLFYLFHAYSRVSLTDVSIQLVIKAFGILIPLSLLSLFITGLEINGL